MKGKDWRHAVLRTLGYKPTPQNLRFLSTWQRWEGGHTNNSARFNWLNTTHGDGESINSVGVKRFKSFDEGIMNTTETLMNGRYQDILDALASGDPYKHAPTAGLQVWVSGRPDGNPGYAQKVLGGKGAAPASSSPMRGAPSPPRAAKPVAALSEADETWNWTMDFLNRNRHDRRFLDSLKALPTFDDTPRSEYYPSPEYEKATPARANGKTLQPGTSWKGSHVTDGLDWNNGQKTARDIMAAPGTAVLAPESGRIVKHGSAQGGQAMYFLSDSGHMYWLGHIDNMLAVGTRVKRGQRIAAISADHDAPHLHIDRYLGKGYKP